MNSKQLKDKMTTDDKKMEFAVFCIESVAEHLSRPAREIYDRMNRLRLLEEYIFPFYDTLHSQSKQYIVSELLQAMDVREEEEGGGR